MNSISRLIQAARLPRSVLEADLMENKCYPNVGQLLITNTPREYLVAILSTWLRPSTYSQFYGEINFIQVGGTKIALISWTSNKLLVFIEKSEKTTTGIFFRFNYNQILFSPVLDPRVVNLNSLIWIDSRWETFLQGTCRSGQLFSGFLLVGNK